LTAIDLSERLTKLVREGLPGTPDEITLDAHFEADLMMNSFALVRLLARVEEEFGILLPEETLGAFHTVRELASIVEVLISPPSVAHTGQY
jgi:acyl carrier protein